MRYTESCLETMTKKNLVGFTRFPLIVGWSRVLNTRSQMLHLTLLTEGDGLFFPLLGNREGEPLFQYLGGGGEGVGYRPLPQFHRYISSQA
jgi:hypothetical protein